MPPETVKASKTWKTAKAKFRVAAGEAWHNPEKAAFTSEISTLLSVEHEPSPGHSHQAGRPRGNLVSCRCYVARWGGDLLRGAKSYCRPVPRQTVQLLAVDADEQLLLLHARDPATGGSHWCPVGGGVERGQ
jgi:hypothetical protein